MFSIRNRRGKACSKSATAVSQAQFLDVVIFTTFCTDGSSPARQTLPNQGLERKIARNL